MIYVNRIFKVNQYLFCAWGLKHVLMFKGLESSWLTQALYVWKNHSVALEDLLMTTPVWADLNFWLSLLVGVSILLKCNRDIYFLFNPFWCVATQFSCSVEKCFHHTAVLCSNMWCESYERYLSVWIFFRYTDFDKLPSTWCVISVSKKANFMPDFNSKVNCIMAQLKWGNPWTHELDPPEELRIHHPQTISKT